MMFDVELGWVVAYTSFVNWAASQNTKPWLCLSRML